MPETKPQEQPREPLKAILDRATEAINNDNRKKAKTNGSEVYGSPRGEQGTTLYVGQEPPEAERTEAARTEAAPTIALIIPSTLSMDTPGRDRAIEIEASYEKIARAIEESAEAQLSIAQSLVSDAEVHLAHAKKHAEGWRTAGQHEIRKSINRHQQMFESNIMLADLQKKLEAISTQHTSL